MGIYPKLATKEFTKKNNRTRSKQIFKALFTQTHKKLSLYKSDNWKEKTSEKSPSSIIFLKIL